MAKGHISVFHKGFTGSTGGAAQRNLPRSGREIFVNRPHWSAWLGAALFGLPTLVVLGLIAFAVLSLRSPGSDSGAEPWAWVVVYAVVLLMAAAMAALGGLLAAGVRRLFRGRRDQPQK